MTPVSICNDVIGPVMRGPSGSHCAAALRLGRLARDLMDGEIAEVLVEFDRAGSLPTTHDSQGSDMGLLGGLLGWEADDVRLPGSLKTFQDAGAEVRVETVEWATRIRTPTVSHSATHTSSARSSPSPPAAA